MYYLVVKNLGVEKCIDMNEEDIYTKNSFYNCQQALTLVKKEFVKKIKISCTGLPGSVINAKVYRD
jgi:hypothetical protein